MCPADNPKPLDCHKEDPEQTVILNTKIQKLFILCSLLYQSNDETILRTFVLMTYNNII